MGVYAWVCTLMSVVGVAMYTCVQVYVATYVASYMDTLLIMKQLNVWNQNILADKLATVILILFHDTK